jgi:hypothetical protein
VLGAQYPEETASQLWVEREHFLPVRWLLILKSNNHDRLDFIYRDWQKHDQQWYPGRIDTYYNHHLIRQLDIRSVRADAYVPAELFDLSHLTSLYPSTAPETQSQMSQTGTDRADRIIEETLRQYTWE